MTKETTLLEEIMILVKKYGYSMSDFILDDKRIEVGLLKDEPLETGGKIELNQLELFEESV